MTKREKNLIFFMLVVMVMAGGFKLLIEPQMTYNTELNTRLLEAQMNQQLLQMETISLPETQEEHQAMSLYLEELRGYIGPYQYDEEIDRRFLSYATPLSLTVEKFSLSTPATLPEEADSSDQLIAPAELTSKIFSITLNGTGDNLLLFINALQSMDDLVITDITQRIEAGSQVSTIQGRIYMDVPTT